MAVVQEGRAGRPVFVSPWERLAERESYGDLPRVIEAAREEAAQGRLGNAWRLYEEALSIHLRILWVGHCGRPGTPFRDAATLGHKLRSARLLDDWTCDALRLVLRRPKSIAWRHLDTVAAFVESLTLQPEGGPG